MAGKGRIPSLDGFRALSVLIVFAGHATFYGMSQEELGEFFAAQSSIFVIPARFGVTIFFFISGYIITTLMRTEFERTQAVSLRNFYLRRVYRIFPPLYIVLAVAAFLTWAGLLKGSVTVSATLAQVLHFTNYYGLLVDKNSFFQGTKLLWSLAVEEHFYLVFPLLFILLSRRLPFRQVGICLAAICALVLAWRFYLYYELGVVGNWAFIATDSRIDSILFGCILGLWHNPVKDEPLVKSKSVDILMLLVAIGVLAFSIGYKDAAFQRTTMFTLQGLAFLPIFACAIRYPDWPVFRWLNWQPLVYVGWISYTFYLCHAIALKVSLRFIDNTWVGYAVAFAATIAFSAAMYRYVEKPLARKRAATHRHEEAPAKVA